MFINNTAHSIKEISVQSMNDANFYQQCARFHATFAYAIIFCVLNPLAPEFSFKF
jgi:hypothetical protein